MAETKPSVEDWIRRIQKTRKSNELLQLLDQFRVQEWTDSELQKVSHTYMRVLDVILKSSTDGIVPMEMDAVGNSGPVWYEKM